MLRPENTNTYVEDIFGTLGTGNKIHVYLYWSVTVGGCITVQRVNKKV